MGSGASGQPAGNPDVWNQVWSEDDNGSTFTEGTPRSLRAFWQRCYADDLRQNLGHAPRRVLELGCGRATTSLYLAQDGHDITLVDLAEQALTQSAEEFSRRNLPVPTIVHADAQDTGLQGDTFDCVYNIGVLEHFENPRPFLAESLRLLRPGGLLWMVVVPAVPPRRSLPVKMLFNPGRALLGTALRGLGRTRPATHTMTRTRLGAGDYEAMAADAGFQQVSCLPYNPYHQVYKNRWLEERVLVPSYRSYRKLTAPLRRGDSLVTRPELALCLILQARKSR